MKLCFHHRLAEVRLHSSPESNVTLVSHMANKVGFVARGIGLEFLYLLLTFTDGTDAGPGAVVPADTHGGADEMVALGTSEMDLMSNEIL